MKSMTYAWDAEALNSVLGNSQSELSKLRSKSRLVVMVVPGLCAIAGLRENRVGLVWSPIAITSGPARSAGRIVSRDEITVHPGLTSWVILSRPFGTDRDKHLELIIFSECATNRAHRKKLIWTGLTFSRPCGTEPAAAIRMGGAASARKCKTPGHGLKLCPGV
jgi:hypothetical protein